MIPVEITSRVGWNAHRLFVPRVRTAIAKSSVYFCRGACNAKVRFEICQILPKIQDLNLDLKDLKDLSKDLKYKSFFTLQFSSRSDGNYY